MKQMIDARKGAVRLAVMVLAMSVAVSCLLAIGNWAFGEDDKAAAIAERDASLRMYKKEMEAIGDIVGNNEVDIYLEGDDVAARRPSLSQVKFAGIGFVHEGTFWRFRRDGKLYSVSPNKVKCFRVYEDK